MDTVSEKVQICSWNSWHQWVGNWLAGEA